MCTFINDRDLGSSRPSVRKTNFHTQSLFSRRLEKGDCVLKFDFEKSVIFHFNTQSRTERLCTKRSLCIKINFNTQSRPFSLVETVY